MLKLIKVTLCLLALLLILPIFPTLAAAPTAPEIITVKASDNGVTLAWKEVSGATSYQVWYKKSSEDDSKLVQKVTNSNSTTITGLEKGTKYSFHVNALNKDGQSPPSTAKEAETTTIGQNLGTTNHLNLLNEIIKGNKVAQKFDFSLGKLVSEALNVALYAAGFLMMIWVFWGIFQYIFAGGNKEALGKARGRIIWAIVGFIFVILAFAVSQYVETFIPQSLPKGITPISAPPNTTTRNDSSSPAGGGGISLPGLPAAAPPNVKPNLSECNPNTNFASNGSATPEGACRSGSVCIKTVPGSRVTYDCFVPATASPNVKPNLNECDKDKNWTSNGFANPDGTCRADSVCFKTVPGTRVTYDCFK